MSVRSGESPRDVRKRRLDRILGEWTAAAESGSAPSREELLLRHPDLDDELRAFFDSLGDATEAGVMHRSPLPSTRAGVRRSTPERLRPGSSFGDFDLIAEIARGGMGVVFKANQRSLNRVVALKMILTGDLASDQEIGRLLVEAEAAASLDHPGIVPVYEVGEHEGYHFLSMGFVDGETLSARLRDGLGPRDAAELVASIAEAVAYAHQRGVVHRDLKPGNVILDAEGRPRITDFGLAKRSVGDHELTVTGQILGTPSFMAPEQAAGGTVEVGAAADIYAMGAILYTLLTGRPPFRAASVMDTLKLVQEADPVGPRTVQPGVPRDLETICLKCLEKSPLGRYASAGELCADLRRYLAGAPILARPVRWPERTWRWCRRHPALVALAAVLVAGAAVSTGFGLRAQRQARTARAAESLAQQREYDASSLLVQASWEQGNLARFVELLEAQKPGVGEPDYRGFEWYYWSNIHRRGYVSLLELPEEVRELSLDRDGERMAIASGALHGAGEVRIWSFEEGRELLRRAFETRVHTVALSPDGKRFAAGTGLREVGNEVTFVDVERDEILFVGKHDKRVWDVAFSPDGTMMASVTAAFDEGMGRLTVWDVETGSPVFSRERGISLMSVVFTPDSERVVIGTGEPGGGPGRIEIWNVATGQRTRVLPVPATFVFALELSPDGETLAAATGEWSGELGRVAFWDLETGRQLTRLLIGHEDRVVALHFSPDGRRIATASFDRTVRIWDAGTGLELQRLRAHQGRVETVRFHPDGRRLASGGEDRIVRLWDAEHGQGAQRLGPAELRAADVAFSPHGNWLAAGGRDGDGAEAVGRLAVWERAGGEPIWLAESPALVTTLAFGPDGERLASGDVAGGIRVWELQEQEPSLKLGDSGDPVEALAFSPDGEWLAWLSGEASSGIRLLNLRSSDELSLPNADSLRTMSLAFSPDGRFVAWPIWLYDGPGSYSSWVTYEFDRSTDPRFFEGRGDVVTRRGWPGPGSPLRGAVLIWDVAARREARRLVSETALPIDLAFSHDGRSLATGNVDGTLAVWDLARTASEPRILRGHADRVYGIAFSPDDRRILSASEDATLRLWNVATGLEVLSLTKREGLAGRLAWSADGSSIAAVDFEGTVTVWDGSP